MRFVLTYHGPLPPSGNRSAHVGLGHDIRCAFAAQLRELMALPPLANARFWDGSKSLDLRESVDGWWFAPIVHPKLHALAELDVLLLRPGPPGKVVQGGDIDNRLKTLLDALRRPRASNQLPQVPNPTTPEEPMPVLLDDDSLVTRVSVEAERRLGRALDGTPSAGNVDVVIRVLTRTTESTWAGIALS